MEREREREREREVLNGKREIGLKWKKSERSVK